MMLIFIIGFVLVSVDVSAQITYSPMGNVTGNSPYHVELVYSNPESGYVDCNLYLNTIEIAHFWGSRQSATGITVPLDLPYGQYDANITYTQILGGSPPSTVYIESVFTIPDSGGIYHAVLDCDTGAEIDTTDFIITQPHSNTVLGLGRCTNTSLIDMASQIAFIVILISVVFAFAHMIVSKQTVKTKLMFIMGILIGLALLGFAMTILLGC